MFQPNSVIAGRYQVIRLVGQGGMSNLYLCYDRKYNNAVVVIKEMTAAYSDPKEQQMAVELFHREAKLLASLNHRHIPKVYDYFQFAGKYYLSMEFIDGEDLAQKLEAKKGPLPETQVLEWGEQMATVLFYLHKHDPPIVFRDVKPSNIMLTEQGVKLIDFGIARHFDQAKKGDTMRIGSPGYAPPEQYAAQTDPRSDIYALGVTLHHALTGRDPTATQTPFLVPPARNLNPALSEASAAMLARATQLDPNDRYQSILEMKNDIKHILSRGKQSTRVVGAPPAPPPGPLPGGAAASAASNSAAPATATAAVAGAGAAAAGAVAAGAVVAGAAGNPASATVAAGLQGAQPVPPVKRKKRRRTGLMLAACALLVLLGGFVAQSPRARETVAQKLRLLLSNLSRSGSNSGPEEAINKALMDGDPRKLLPLFGNGTLAGLSQDKQALYRLNLLAAEISPPDPSLRPGILHLLYPEEMVGTPEEESLFRASAQALGAINGSGGVGKQLLIVLPRSYASGSLDGAIARLASEKASGGQRLLILDPNSEAAQLSPESLGLKPMVLGDSAPPTVPSLAWRAGQEPALLFSWKKVEGKLLWAAAGAPPTSLKAQKVELADGAEGLSRLLQRSASEQAVLVVEAERLAGQEGAGAEGRLLLLAAGPASLPKLAPGAKAEALVLGSPVRQADPSAPVGGLFPSPSGGLSWSQGRLFDAVALSAKPASMDYSGITVTRPAEGKDLPGLAVRYRWTASGWVPSLQNK
jgi:serine/threonine-protein kinase